jgi:hypothetical protein
MNNLNILNPKKLLAIIVICCSSQVLVAEPNGLELTLSKKEQSLLDSFEQKKSG